MARFDYMAQVNAWPAEWQKIWRTYADDLKAGDPACRNMEPATLEFFAFRTVRDQMLRDGALQLEQVPGWNMKGPARPQSHFDALQPDRSYERMIEGVRRRDVERARAKAVPPDRRVPPED